MTRFLVPLLLIVALGVRVVEVERTSYRPVNDAAAYMKLAGEIADGGSYSSRDPGAGGTRGPSAYWPPGFSYFLAAVDLLDGHRAAHGAAVQPARLAQAVLGTVTTALVWLVALELFGQAIALIALAIAAVYPVLIEVSGLILAENLATALILGATWAVLRSRRSSRPSAWIVAGGFVSGLAMLTHQNAAVILIPLAAGVWPPTSRSRLRSLRAPGLLVAVAFLTIVPWTIRNAVVLHHFIPISDETGITLRGTYNPSSAASTAVPYQWRIYTDIPQDRELARGAQRLTEAELGSRLQSRALRYIADHPLAPLDAALHNTLRLLDIEGSRAWQVSAASADLPRQTAEIGVASFWLLCLLAALGAASRAARTAPRWVWAVPLLLALSVVFVNAETPRFREPIEPFLVLLAACAADAARRLVRRAPVASRLEAAPASGDRELIDVRERLT